MIVDDGNNCCWKVSFVKVIQHASRIKQKPPLQQEIACRSPENDCPSASPMSDVTAHAQQAIGASSCCPTLAYDASELALKGEDRREASDTCACPAGGQQCDGSCVVRRQSCRL